MPDDDNRKEVPWHSLTDEEVLKEVEAESDGLRADEARRRLEQHGKNTLEREEGFTPVNRWLLLGVGIAVLLQLGAIYSDIGQTIFRTTSLNISDWLLIVPVASTVLIADEVLKLLGVHGKRPASVSKGK
jgi:magnesium-transporting ATPase (P-type)